MRAGTRVTSQTRTLTLTLTLALTLTLTLGMGGGWKVRLLRDALCMQSYLYLCIMHSYHVLYLYTQVRFFVLLSTHELLYFESDKSPKCKGVIDLNEATACQKVANPDYNY